MASIGSSALRSGLSRQIGAILSPNLRLRAVTRYCVKRNIAVTSQCFGKLDSALVFALLGS